MTSAAGSRHAGLLVPLFSVPSSRSWGIGEIGDIPIFGRWLRRAGLDLWQLLPVNEMAEAQHSPYSALSAMAIDPIFISLADMEDYAALGGEAAMDASTRLDLADARSTRTIDYDTVRALKDGALRESFERFLDVEWPAGTARAHRLAAFCEREAWWLDDYALFRALHARFARRWWREWDDGLRRRDPAALERARHDEAREILFHQYLQWIAAEQWERARAACGVLLFGDFPFMVSGDSADTWVHQDAFDLDASVGTPPDAFAKDGQNWGLPAYRWDVMRARDFAWLRERARRSAELFDGYRLDHLVGFYRTYIRPAVGTPYFSPADETDQRTLGEQVLGALAASGPRIIAEDLGTVPDFVRASIVRLGIPGYRVLRWEREWTKPGQPFRDPAGYPRASVATTGTHDTDPLAVWWDALPAAERAQVAALPSLRARGLDWSSATLTPDLRDAFLDALAGSGSDYLLLPIQDVFGWRDRINVPGTVNDENWTWRFRWSVDTLDDEPEVRAQAESLRTLCRRYGRGAFLAGLFLLLFFARPVTAQTRLRVEFTPEGDCVVSTSGPGGRASVKYPRRTADRRCAVPSLSQAPGSEGVEIEVILPAGEPRPVDEFPRMQAWTSHAGQWIGTARVDGMPAFVRVPPATAGRRWRARALDGGVLLAVALGIAWAVARGRAS